ncbi:MAG TPA: hypothetical protein VH497_15040 [Vicinamibacterales bacterium]
MIARLTLVLGLAASAAFAAVALASAQVKAELPAGIAPPWTSGIQAINQTNYWNAVACGKQGGQRPLCVFYDAVLCPNDDFTLAMFTPYKMVAYEVWRAVNAHQAAPTPSYAEAQRTRISVKLTPKPAAKNPVAALTIRRGEQTVKPVSQSLDAGVGTFIFDFAAFAPTGDISFEMAGKARTVSCAIDKTVLSSMR